VPANSLRHKGAIARSENALLDQVALIKSPWQSLKRKDKDGEANPV
jgi:hypothetical protein